MPSLRPFFAFFASLRAEFSFSRSGDSARKDAKNAKEERKGESHLGEVTENLKAGGLALLRMELNSEDVPSPADRCES